MSWFHCFSTCLGFLFSSSSKMPSRLEPGHVSHRQALNNFSTQDLGKAEDIWKKHCWFGAPWKKKRIKIRTREVWYGLSWISAKPPALDSLRFSSELSGTRNSTGRQSAAASRSCFFKAREIYGFNKRDLIIRQMATVGNCIRQEESGF